MSISLSEFFIEDHRRLDDLFERATANPDHIDMELYAQFRVGLMKHISIEEKILLPAAQQHRGGQPLDIAAKIRLDHGAIAALLVPPPSGTIIAALRDILRHHDILEESIGGMYALCQQSIGADQESLMEKIRQAADVPANPFNTNPNVLEATRRALARAGYHLDDYQSDTFSS